MDTFYFIVGMAGFCSTKLRSLSACLDRLLRRGCRQMCRVSRDSQIDDVDVPIGMSVLGYGKAMISQIIQFDSRLRCSAPSPESLRDFVDLNIKVSEISEWHVDRARIELI
jgi:hypothetical protein